MENSSNVTSQLNMNLEPFLYGHHTLYPFTPDEHPRNTHFLALGSSFPSFISRTSKHLQDKVISWLPHPYLFYSLAFNGCVRRLISYPCNCVYDFTLKNLVKSTFENICHAFSNSVLFNLFINPFCWRVLTKVLSYNVFILTKFIKLFMIEFKLAVCSKSLEVLPCCFSTKIFHCLKLANTWLLFFRSKIFWKFIKMSIYLVLPHLERTWDDHQMFEWM